MIVRDDWSALCEKCDRPYECSVWAQGMERPIRLCHRCADRHGLSLREEHTS